MERKDDIMRDVQKAPWPGWNTIRLIGQGSFGTVYEIQRELVDGTVETAAMKVLTIPQNPSDVTEMYSEGYNEESITATFQAHLKNIVAEYTLMRKLDGSANVVNCKDISYIQHDDGIGWDIYIRMELLTPLMKALPDSIDEETVVKLARDICAALVLCKKYGIVHRDIKPQNIFISANGDYKLGDFGIAKTVEKTMGGTKIGTYKYMAPEVYNNQPYGSAADIYSLGLVLYWMLNERRMPFVSLPPARTMATQDEQARQRRLSGEPLPPPAHGSAELKRIVLKACAYAPKDRYHAADEMLADLNALDRERVFAKSDERVFPDESYCRNEDDATEIADAISTETVGVFETDREKTVAAEASDYSCQHENETAETVGVKWKDESKESRLAEKPSKKRRHKILPVAVAAILICVVGGIYGYTHCWFGHVWEAANCTVPATCTRCGATSGSALGHSWNAATCTAPETCSRCGVTSGAALGHNWPTMEELSYCLRCNYPNGKLKQMDVGDWHSEWTNETVKFGLGNGKTVDCTPFKPSTKIEKCYSLTLHLEIKQYSYGNIEGEWGFYIHDLNGEWHLADSFILSGNQAEVHFEFDKPISFDLWACPCHCLGSDWSFSYAAWLHNIRVFELAK